MIASVLQRFLFIFLAYALAASVTGYAVDLSLLWGGGGMADDARMGFWGFAIVITSFTAYFAASPAALTIALGEYFNLRMWTYYAIAGAAIGLGLGYLFVTTQSYFPWLGLSFGPVAGLIYWAIAGRNAGVAEAKATRIIVGVMALICLIIFWQTWGTALFRWL